MIALLISLVALSAFLFGKIAGVDGVLNVALAWYWFAVTVGSLCTLIPITNDRVDKFKNRLNRGRIVTYSIRLVSLATALALAYFGYFVLVGFYLVGLILSISFDERLKAKKAEKDKKQ